LTTLSSHAHATRLGEPAVGVGDPACCPAAGVHLQVLATAPVPPAPQGRTAPIRGASGSLHARAGGHYGQRNQEPRGLLCPRPGNPWKLSKDSRDVVLARLMILRGCSEGSAQRRAYGRV
jgi:hypothetical protein